MKKKKIVGTLLEEKKLCKQCGNFEFFYKNQFECKECSKKSREKNRTTKEGLCIDRIRGILKGMKKNNIKIPKFYKVTQDTIKKLYDVFDNKSFINYKENDVNDNDKKSNNLTKKKNEPEFMIWFKTFDEDFNPNNAFICSNNEFKFIIKYGYELKHALKFMFQDKTEKEIQEKIDSLNNYNKKKKELGIWIDNEEKNKNDKEIISHEEKTGNDINKKIDEKKKVNFKTYKDNKIKKPYLMNINHANLYRVEKKEKN